MTLETALLLAAFIFFVLAAFSTNTKVNLTAAGLACFTLSLLSPLV